MNYAQSYKNVLHGQPLYEGARVTAGILIPALLMSCFNQLAIGIVLSLGAICVSVTDSQGPIVHRRNGMVACIVFIFVVSILVGFAAINNLALAILVLVCSFFFSMLNIYGTRAGAIGIASLLTMVLSLDEHLTGVEVVYHALYIALGGLWFMCFSILLYNVRPYKLAQQAMGDCVQSIAEYLRVRAGFYDKQVDYDDNYKRLLQQQVAVQEKQHLAAELLFKTPDIVNESTRRGRILVMSYMDMADILERIMTSYQNYKTLHQFFDEVDILGDFSRQALLLADEIDEIGTAIKSGVPSVASLLLDDTISKTRNKLKQLRETHMKPGNIEGFINLRRIMENIEDIQARLKTLHQYTTYDRAIDTITTPTPDYDQFISHQDITPEMFRDNLSIKSDTLRHSLRVTIAMIVGFVVSLFFKVGHGYWILLTILVILKPAYGLTKTRNKDRLLGTAIGIVIGIVIIYLVHNKTALLFIMIALMLGTYSFLRQKYFVSVILMTPYIIIFFHLLNPSIFQSVLVDRMADTVIGSAIAFAANKFLFPAWEREKLQSALVSAIQKMVTYFDGVPIMPTPAKVALQPVNRKNVLVALANLSDSFRRMLTEPRSEQVGVSEVQRFVVLCHMLVSHIASLGLLAANNPFAQNDYNIERLFILLQHYLEAALATLKRQQVTDEISELKNALRLVNEQAKALIDSRQQELKKGWTDSETRAKLHAYKSLTDQFNFIFNIVTDLHKESKALVSVGVV